MNNIVFILIIIFTIFFYIIKISPKKETMFSLKKLKNLRLPKKLDITLLEKVPLELFFRYGDSTNHFYNDGRTIYQECIKLLNNRVIINGYRFGLAKIDFTKSILSWYGQKVGLELRLTHQSVQSQQVNVFIIPLSLVDLRKETFVDFNKTKKKSDKRLNTIITKIEQVPSYRCCTANQGPLVNVNLCPVATLLLRQQYFFKYQMSDNITYYITKPQEFDRLIGLNIRQKLSG